jgi:hypothetical protein
MTRCMRLSSVKVPRPASPFITHETPLSGGTAVAVSRGNGKEEVENKLTDYFIE